MAPPAARTMTPLWSFKLAKERRVQARAPVPWGEQQQLLLALHYDKAGFFESRLLALDARSGAERWSQTVAHVGNEPLVQGDSCYWSAFDGSVRALDPAGRPIWHSTLSERCNLGQPLLAGDRLLVGEIGGGASAVHCLDRLSGRPLWRFDSGGHAYPMAVQGDLLFVSVAASTGAGEPARGLLHAIELASGRPRWTAAEPRGDYCFNPLPIGDRVDRVAIAGNRVLQLLDARSGKRLAELALASERSTLRLLPQAAGDDEQPLLVWQDGHGQGDDSLSAVALTRSRGFFFGGDKHGLSLRWRQTLPRGLQQAPLRLPDRSLACLTRDGAILRLDAASGASLGETPLPGKKPAASDPTGGLALGEGGQLFVSQGAEAFALPLDALLAAGPR